MQEHLRGHSKERVAACPTCGVLYSSRMRLIDHIKRQAAEECKFFFSLWLGIGGSFLTSTKVPYFFFLKQK